MKKQSFINLISQIFMFLVNLGISFFLVPYITEKIGIEAYGYVGLANDFVGYAQLLTVALNSMASRFITIKIHENNYEKANKYYSSVIFANIFISLILFLVSLVFIIFMDKIISIPTNLILDVKLLFALIVLNFISSIINSTFAVSTFTTNKLYLSSLRNIEGQIIRVLILLVTFYFLKPSVWYVGLSVFLCTTYISVWNYKYTKKLTPKLTIKKIYFDFKCVKELISAGIWNTISKLSSILSSGLNLLITNIFIGSTSMGLLSFARTIPNLILSAFGTISSVFAPQLTISFAKKEYQDMKLQLISTIKFFGLLSSIPICILIAYGYDFFVLWAPSQNHSFIYLLSLIACIDLLFCLPLEPLYNVFTAVNKIKNVSLFSIFSSIITLIVTFIGLNLTNDPTTKLIIVAGTNTIISAIRVLTFLPLYGANVLNLKWTTFYPTIIKNTVSTIILIIISLIIKKIIVLNNWLNLIIVCGITVIIGLIVNAYILLTKEERNIYIKNIKNKLKKGAN